MCAPDRRFAFCLSLQQRAFDEVYDPATGASMSRDQAAGLSLDQKLMRMGRRPPTVRVEAIYELLPDGNTL